jgi:hypothetical protein
MQVLGLLGLAAFVLVSLVLGVRLVGLAARTRQFPELAIGVSFLLSGFVGTGLGLVGTHAQALSPETRMVLRLAGAFASHVGYALLAGFVARVFRPDLAGATGFAVSVFGLGVGFGMQVGYATPSAAPAAVSPGFWTSLAVQVATYAWATCESFRQWDLARRRVRIGLGDPLVAQRFLCWGLSTSIVIAIWLHLAVALVRRTAATLSGGDYLVIAALGFACAAASWLSFFPAAWMRRSAAQAGGASTSLRP